MAQVISERNLFSYNNPNMSPA